MKPISELNLTWRQAQKAIQGHFCKECNAIMSVAWGGSFGIDDWVIRCPVNINHDGMIKEYENTEAILAMYGKTPKWRVKELAEKNQQALTKYVGRQELMKTELKEIINVIWKDARLNDGTWVQVPEKQKEIALMKCATYKLNPAMGQIFIVPFKNNKTGEVDWSQFLSISAKRNIARSKMPFRYIEYKGVMTPRVLRKAEAQELKGDEYKEGLIYAVCHIENPKTLATGFGIGVCSKADNVKGTDKGNTADNMAEIRAESKALNRLCGDAIPMDDVVPDNVIDVTDYEVLPDVQKPMEQIEEPIPEPEPKPVDKSESLPNTPSDDAVSAKSETEREASPIDISKTCPEHLMNWVLDKYKLHLYHYTKDKVICAFRNYVAAELNELTEANQDLLKQSAKLAYGKSWSQIPEPEQWKYLQEHKQEYLK